MFVQGCETIPQDFEHGGVIAMAQQDALGVSGCTGGIDQACDIVPAGFDGRHRIGLTQGFQAGEGKIIFSPDHHNLFQGGQVLFYGGDLVMDRGVGHEDNLHAAVLHDVLPGG